MKKIIPLSMASLIVLSGCIWPAVDGAPVYGVPYDQSIAEQPKYNYEHYNAWEVSAVERNSLSREVADFNQNSSFKMQETLRKSILEVKQKYPLLFKKKNDIFANEVFLVGALVNAKDINKSEKAGRIVGMGLTDAIGKTATAKYVRYKRDMLAVQNKMVVPTAEASRAAAAFKADIIVMGAYTVNADDIAIRYAFYDAKTRAFLAEGSAAIPLDRNTTKFASDI